MASTSNSVRRLVQRLEQGGPSTDAASTQPVASGASAASVVPSPQIDHQEPGESKVEPGVHVSVINGRGFPVYAEVGSYVCLSVLGDSDDVAELAIGLVSLTCRFPEPTPFSAAPLTLLPCASLPSANAHAY